MGGLTDSVGHGIGSVVGGAANSIANSLGQIVGQTSRVVPGGLPVVAIVAFVVIALVVISLLR
ncbi:MAG: hypothetical protein ACRDGQ_14870 [Candidatus Limnocylindrales bacterium]